MLVALHPIQVRRDAAARVVVCALPRETKAQRAVALTVSRALSIPAPRAMTLLSDVPFVVPRKLSATEASSLLHSLQGLGAPCKLDHVETPPLGSCSTHSELDGAEKCNACDSVICAVCAHD